MPEPTPGSQLTGGATPPPDDIVVAMRNVRKSFGQKEVLKGLTVSVPRGTSAVIMGGSGTGKSVSIRHVVRLLKPDAGEIWVEGERVDLAEGDDLDRIRLKIGYLFQGGALFDSMNVEENMLFYLDRHTTLTAAEKRERIEEAVAAVNLPDTLAQYPAQLSGGQKKRIGLARALILQPDILLYDEPTTGLDPISVRVVSELIVRLREERGMSSIAITHDLLCAEIIADSVHFIKEGRISAAGTLDEVRRSDDPTIQAFFRDYTGPVSA
jgi:phospholipid/cholesterol/gamma-HCH transport system ATP-binding protein